MEVWSVFWISLFAYWSIKESIALITYNKRQAIRDLVKKEYGKRIAELVSEKVTNSSDELDSEDIDEIIEDLGE